MNKTQKINKVILARSGAEFDPVSVMIRLREIFEAAGMSPTMENFGRVAADLSRIAGVSPEWSAKYVQSVYKGYKGCAASPSFGRAVDLYFEVIDGVPVEQVGLVSIPVLARADQFRAGSFAPPELESVKCARPGCRVFFLRTTKSKKYHSPECRAEWDKERKRIGKI